MIKLSRRKDANSVLAKKNKSKNFNIGLFLYAQQCVDIYVNERGYIQLNISFCYSSIPLTLVLIGRDGGLSTVCHSCGFDILSLLLFFFSAFPFHLLLSLSLTLIISIFCCLHYTLLLLRLITTHLVSHFLFHLLLSLSLHQLSASFTVLITLRYYFILLEHTL